MNEIKDVANIISDIPELQGVSATYLSVGGLMFSAGMAGLSGNITREYFLEIAAHYYDSAVSERRQRAH